MIGLLDELAVQPGFRHYTLAFPTARANSSHVLGFHLDPFTLVQSSLVITNVSLSLAGVSEPFTLSMTTNKVGGSFVYELNGEPNHEYHVQASTNLVDWTNICTLLNTNGTVRFFDQDSTNNNQRFYRALVAPE
jgi:hypothetical protein